MARMNVDRAETVVWAPAAYIAAATFFTVDSWKCFPPDSRSRRALEVKQDVASPDA
jgi:hypothetical protein